MDCPARAGAGEAGDPQARSHEAFGDIAGNVDVIGNGVTLYFAGTGELTISGGNNVDLTAPTDGDFAGVLVYGDRSQPESVQHTLNGTDTTIFGGAIYTPSANVELNGTPGMSSGANFTVLISRTVSFNGIGDFAFNSDYENSTVPVPYAMKTVDKLVE